MFFFCFFVVCSWVPTLNANDVADRVISAIKKNEKIAIIPGYIKILLSLKWFVLNFVKVISKIFIKFFLIFCFKGPSLGVA